MKILYCEPVLGSVYASHFIYQGYQNAFLDKGHQFRTFTANDSFEQLLEEYQPDIFFYRLHFWHLKFVDLGILKKYRDKGLVVFCQLRMWHESDGELGFGALKDDTRSVKYIKDGLAGDIFWHWIGQETPLMEGFEKETGYTYETIRLAADKTVYYHDYDKDYLCDLSYVGSLLKSKKAFMKKCVLPLKEKYDIKIFGSDWTFQSRLLGKIQKLGQYFDIRSLKGIRQLPLSQEGERKLYSSAKINLNVHEDRAKRHNIEINERTFKIMACGGFELVDNMPLVRVLFDENELVLAKDNQDWFDKIDYYLKHEDKRLKIAKAGQNKVLAEHTYHHRVDQIINLYHQFKDK